MEIGGRLAWAASGVHASRLFLHALHLSKVKEVHLGTSGQPSDSGIMGVRSATARYSVSIWALAGIHPNAGAPKSVPRSIIRRRVSGNGDIPNSMPRVIVAPFQVWNSGSGSLPRYPSRGNRPVSTRSRSRDGSAAKTPRRRHAGTEDPSDVPCTTLDLGALVKRCRFASTSCPVQAPAANRRGRLAADRRRLQTCLRTPATAWPTTGIP